LLVYVVLVSFPNRSLGPEIPREIDRRAQISQHQLRPIQNPCNANSHTVISDRKYGH
jgi:hypothetical protein